MKNLLIALALILAINSIGALPAFPGAEGFGAETPGGRGGTVLFVTNLNDAGPGSFRQALLTPGKRIIVFRVSGVVQGTGQIFLAAENLSYVTIAGQTSPGGITITTDPGTPIWQYGDVKFHDAIWRFLRFRVVRESGGNGGDHAFEQYRSHHYIIDHCDFSGGDDECLDMCYAHHFTIQWSTICNSGPGGQCYGALFAYTDPASSPLGHISLHHNLIANHSKRGPEMHWSDKPLPDSGKVDFRNNVVYNITQYGTRIHGVNDTSILQLTLVGNYWKAGPIGLDFAPVTTFLPVHVYANNNYWTGPSKQDIRDVNIMAGDQDTLFRTSYGASPTLVFTPWNVPAVTTHTPQQAYDTVLARVGAWPRDSMNARTVREVKTATGGLGKCDDPLITSGPAAPADADNDGMSDSWELSRGLNPTSAADNILDRDGDGYTNIEEYINCLADSLLGKPCNPTAIESKAGAALKGPALSVTPNPVSVSAAISVSGMETLTRQPLTLLTVYDVRGKEAANLLTSTYAGQSHKIHWSVGNLPNGTYLLKARAGARMISKRIFIIK